MKLLIMPLLATLMAFAFWPTFAADTVPDYATYATILDVDQAVTDAVVPVPTANHATSSALADDNVPVDKAASY